jgi:hypothetical protein
VKYLLFFSLENLSISQAHIRVPTYPEKWEKPGNFIPLAPGWVMSMKQIS